MRLSQVAKILNKGISSVVGSLSAKGFKVDSNPNTKINAEQLEVLAKEYKSNELLTGARRSEPSVAVAEPPRRKEEDVILYRRDDAGRPIVDTPKPEASKPAETPRPSTPQPATPSTQSVGTGLPGLKVVGKIDLNARPGTSSSQPAPEQPKVVSPQPAPAPTVERTRPTEPVAPPKPAPTVPAATPPQAEVAKPVEKPQPAPVQPQPVAVTPPAPPKPVETPKPEAPQPVAAQPVARPEEKPAAPVENRQPAAQQPAQPTPTPQQPGNQQRTQPTGNAPQERRDDRRDGQRPHGQADRPANQSNRPANQQNQPRPEQNRPREERTPTPPAAPVTDSDETSVEPETIRAAGSHQLGGLKILGKIELPVNNPRQGGGNSAEDRKKKRKRIRGREGAVGGTGQPNQPGTPREGGQPQGQGGNNFRNDRNDRGPREGGQRDGAPREARDGQGQNQGDRNQAPANRNTNPNQQGQGGGGNNTNNRNQGQGGGGRSNTNTNNRPGQGGGNNANRGGTGRDNNRRDRREAPSEADVRASIRATNARMAGNQPNRGADRRRDRRNERAERSRLLDEQEQLEAKTLKVTEFVSANDLASLMSVSVNEVISVCLNLGMFVSINQRLDAEAITVIADEFGFDVQFVSAEDETEAGVGVEADDPQDLAPRAPIVTIMGHVDHGKTSLLDYIRRAKVAAGEAGGITQHIGAYSVKTADDRMITFLDTPGHEAFTAMRARGAKVTDVVIIVIAADDSVMPQTREAINHAQVAGVPIVFAFSKVDKPGADAEKIRQELATMNLLVEEWGGKYQAQEISSKSGMGVDDLLEKVLLEAELLELKANPSRRALGTVIEASLDKGRGYVSTVLVENGTLRQGDIMLVGAHYGRIRAMTNDRGERIKEAGPATPVQILGLPGAPQAGDKFNVMETEREAREIANKREQLLREQTLRTRKHITLEEIGRRKAIGSFKELNVIVKGDVDGSVEALSDSLLQLSTEEVQVNIIHKAVGQISESDILLASASDAIIVGFQVRPSANARRLAEQEQIEIRLYSIIYDAINEVKDAMEGLLAPTTEEVITGNIEVRDVFKISKVGTVAGCYVTEGTIKRNNKIRVIRDFIVIHTGEISALKRFKDDVGEVRSGYECGLSVKNFNDIEVGDTIEAFEIKEVKRTL